MQSQHRPGLTVPARATGRALSGFLPPGLRSLRHHTHTRAPALTTPHTPQPPLSTFRISVSTMLNMIVGPQEPNRSALQQRRGGCRDRSEFKNRTEQIVGLNPVYLSLCACVCRVPCCGHKPNVPRCRSTNSAREVGGRPRMRSTTSVTSEAPPITSRKGCALGATAVCSSYDRGSTRT